jgi:hypothetical protein
MWVRVAFAALGVGVVCAFAAARLGERRWQAASDRVVATLRSREASSSAPYSEAELADLPPPVARYFRRVLREGQPIITDARITWEGQFNMGTPGARTWARCGGSGPAYGSCLSASRAILSMLRRPSLPS